MGTRLHHQQHDDNGRGTTRRTGWNGQWHVKLSQNGRSEIVADAGAGSDDFDAACRYQEDKYFTPAARHSPLPAMAA